MYTDMSCDMSQTFQEKYFPLAPILSETRHHTSVSPPGQNWIHFKGNMDIRLCFVVALCLCGVSQGLEEEGNANDYVDQILASMRADSELMDRLEPVKLPDVDGRRFQMRQGKLWGVTTLHRRGDCTGNSNNTHFVFSANLGTHRLWFEALHRMKVGFFWVRGRLQGSVQLTGALMSLAVDYQTGQFQLVDFKITQLGGLHFKKLTGFSFLLNWMVRLIVNTYIRDRRELIMKILEKEMTSAIRLELTKITPPLVY